MIVECCSVDSGGDGENSDVDNCWGNERMEVIIIMVVKVGMVKTVLEMII